MFFINFKGFFMKICIYNNKGGVGKTTLTTSVGFRAIEKGRKIVVVDADFQRNSMNMLTGGEYNGDVAVDVSSIQIVSGLENYQYFEDSDFVVIDAPPEFNFMKANEDMIKDIDVWIVPVRGRFSIDGAENVNFALKEMGIKGARVVYVVMQSDGNTEIGKMQIEEAKRSGVELFKYAIGKHMAFEKSEFMCCPVWTIPYSVRSGSVQALQLFADWVLGGCSNSNTYGNTDKRLSKYEV